VNIAKALTIAGSDSGGGAGIQADLKTFQELGVFGMSALTAVTAQNTKEVTGIYELPPEAVAKQIDAVVTDIGVDAAKTGMISSVPIMEIIAAKVKEHRIHHLVIDPVMISKSGAALLKEEARHALKRLLIPLAEVVTPQPSRDRSADGHHSRHRRKAQGGRPPDRRDGSALRRDQGRSSPRRKGRRSVL